MGSLVSLPGGGDRGCTRASDRVRTSRGRRPHAGTSLNRRRSGLLVRCRPRTRSGYGEILADPAQQQRNRASAPAAPAASSMQARSARHGSWWTRKAIVQELGLRVTAAAAAETYGIVEMLAGDAAAVERELASATGAWRSARPRTSRISPPTRRRSTSRGGTIKRSSSQRGRRGCDRAGRSVRGSPVAGRAEASRGASERRPRRWRGSGDARRRDGFHRVARRRLHGSRRRAADAAVARPSPRRSRSRRSSCTSKRATWPRGRAVYWTHSRLPDHIRFPERRRRSASASDGISTTPRASRSAGSRPGRPRATTLPTPTPLSRSSYRAPART